MALRYNEKGEIIPTKEIRGALLEGTEFDTGAAMAKDNKEKHPPAPQSFRATSGLPIDERDPMRECGKCHQKLRTRNYYMSRRKDKYPPDGLVPYCKKCYTMHVNVNEPSTFISLLEDLDLPYIPSVWTSVLESYKNKMGASATAIFGRYVSRMKLPQYSAYTYADSSKFEEDEKLRKIKETAERVNQINRYRDAEGANDAMQNLEYFTPEEIQKYFKNSDLMVEKKKGNERPDIDAELDNLTMEDKKYLLSKWGKTYTIAECIKLEKLYLEMLDSYDIRTASHFDYLLKICRISLKIDQALEINDIDGVQKMSRTYDMLMKSAKFTAAQNKDQADDYTDAIGVLVKMCEEQGFITDTIDERQDIVDYTIADLKGYTEHLIKDELNLGNMIEVYLQKMVQEEAKQEDEMGDEDDLVFVREDEEDEVLRPEDYEEFNDTMDEEAEIDDHMLEMSEELS